MTEEERKPWIDQAAKINSRRKKEAKGEANNVLPGGYDL